MQKAFIETQFPIARLSAESDKERKAGASQTLTGLGKWWGRKPLILVRACILGMLMPASDDPKKDREIFLKILTMDDDGTWQRQKGEIPVKAWREAAPAEIQDKYFGARGFQRGISDEEKEFVLAEIWEGLSDQQRQRHDLRLGLGSSQRAASRLALAHDHAPVLVSGNQSVNLLLSSILPLSMIAASPTVNRPLREERPHAETRHDRTQATQHRAPDRSRPRRYALGRTPAQAPRP